MTDQLKALNVQVGSSETILIKSQSDLQSLFSEIIKTLAESTDNRLSTVRHLLSTDEISFRSYPLSTIIVTAHVTRGFLSSMNVLLLVRKSLERNELPSDSFNLELIDSILARATQIQNEFDTYKQFLVDRKFEELENLSGLFKTLDLMGATLQDLKNIKE